MRTKICGIYKITNMVNGKVIIGQSTSIYERWTAYRSALRRNVEHNSHLQRSWNKYGQINFKFEIILECQEEKLDDEERRLIKEHNSTDRNFGYNLESGGNINKHHSEETKKKMSLSQLGKTLSESTKQKIGIANTGHYHSEESKQKMSKALKGKVRSEETRRNIIKALTGRHHTEESKQKMSKAQTGKRLSEDTIRKISLAKTGVVEGKNNPMFGKCHSEEAKQRISKANSGRHHTEEDKQKMREAHTRRRLLKLVQPNSEP